MFTCAGRRVALLEAFRRAMAELDVAGKIIATDVSPASAAYVKADIGLLSPSVDSAGYISSLREDVDKHGVGLLIPLTDLDLHLLAKHRDSFKAKGCTVMVGGQESIALCRDKAMTNVMLARAGLATISTRTLVDFLRSPSYPCFVKPVGGSAGVGACVISDEKELRSHVESFGEALLVQEYIPGQEFTIDVYRTREGQVRCVVPRQRLAVRSGEVEKGVTVFDQDLIDAACKLSSHLGDVWGVFCCQCRRSKNGDKPRFFEVNPRFGGGSMLAIAAGVNLPLYLLQEVLGLPISAELGRFTDHLLMLRYDEAVFVPSNDLTALPGYDTPTFR